jgi:PAS domain S-box-containing protein
MKFYNFFSNKKLINHYIPALFLIIIFSTLGYVNLKDIIESVENDGSNINISGRQRMLSQKLVILANKYQKNPDYHSEFIDTLDKIEKSHIYLLKNINSDNVLKIYYKDNFNNEEDYTRKIEYLKSKGLLFFIGIILVVLIEGIFIFYPVNKKIKNNTKKLEDAIREKTNELQKSIDIISDYVIYSKTDLKGTITYASNAFCEISGYSKEELLGKPHNIIRHPDMPKSAFYEMWQTIKKGKVWAGEVKNLKKDKGYYWVKANISPDYDEKGNLIGYVGVRYDITHKKELEELNKNLEKKITIEINKNREKDKLLFEHEKVLQLNEMIENIAHHWRQPLSVISTCVSGVMLKKELEILDDEDLDDSLIMVNNTAQKLSETINEFANFNKLNKKEESFNLVEVINKTINIVSSSFNNHNIQIERLYENKFLEITSIPGDFSQILLNILNNSKDAFMKDNYQNKKISIDISNIKNQILISIKDNAGGIGEENLSKIFDPYFTTKHKSQGTGLGLSMCKTIVNKNLKGDIYAHDIPNGAEFIIELPQKL